MKSNWLYSKIFIIAMILINAGFDQLTKAIAREQLNYHQSIPVIKNYFHLIKVENYGAFLSSGDSLPDTLKFILLSLVPLLVLIYGIIFLMRKENLEPLFILGLCFVIGGGAGNLYDRFVHGSVTDFMHMDLIIFQTGVFNVADLSIMTGISMVFFHVYLKKGNTETTTAGTV